MLKIGDLVRIYRKNDKLDKQHISIWSKQRYMVTDTIKDKGQTFYKTRWNDVNHFTKNSLHLNFYYHILDLVIRKQFVMSKACGLSNVVNVGDE